MYTIDWSFVIDVALEPIIDSIMDIVNAVWPVFLLLYGTQVIWKVFRWGLNHTQG